MRLQRLLPVFYLENPMAYEDIYIAAREAEQAALAEGKTAGEAYAAWFAVIRRNVRERIERQDIAHSAAQRARSAADRLLYEGRLSQDDPRYIAAVKHADALGDVFRSI